VAALRPDALSTALPAAPRWQQAFVPDSAGSGPPLYTARPEAVFRPRFGPRHAPRHQAAGAVELAQPGLRGLRRDVDEPADLRGASELGLGTRTATLAARLAAPSRAQELGGPGAPPKS